MENTNTDLLVAVISGLVSFLVALLKYLEQKRKSDDDITRSDSISRSKADAGPDE
jgi:hypothetical protein